MLARNLGPFLFVFFDEVHSHAARLRGARLSSRRSPKAYAVSRAASYSFDGTRRLGSGSHSIPNKSEPQRASCVSPQVRLRSGFRKGYVQQTRRDPCCGAWQNTAQSLGRDKRWMSCAHSSYSLEGRRTTSTEQWACLTTESATLPNRSRPTPLSPPDPSMIRSACQPEA